MALEKLQRRQKLKICFLRILKGSSYQDIADHLKEEWQYTCSRQAVGNFLRSDEGEQMVEDAYAHLRREFSNEPVIEKSTRVLALREQVLKLQSVLRTLAVEEEEWISYSQEFRQYIKQIAIEMDGIQVNVMEGKSAAEMAMAAAVDKKSKLKLVK